MADTKSFQRENLGENPPGNGQLNRRRVRGILLFIVGSAVLLAGFWGYNELFVAGFESTDDAEVQGNQAIISSQTLGQIRTLEVDRGTG